MSERSRPDLDGVRDAMRARDDAPSPSAPPAAASRSPSEGPSEIADGVATTQIDVAAEERFQTLRRELGVSAFGLNAIRLRPGQRGRIHRHKRQEEVYVVLEGTLSLAVEGEDDELALQRGAVVRVAPGLRRQLTNRGDELVVLLAIGGAEPHEGRDGEAFESWDDEEGRPPQHVPQPPDLPPSGG